MCDATKTECCLVCEAGWKKQYIFREQWQNRAVSPGQSCVHGVTSLGFTTQSGEGSRRRVMTM